MAQLTDTVLNELMVFFYSDPLEKNAAEVFKTWYASVSPSKEELAINLQGEWAAITETERRIFQSPQNYCDVLAEWRRSSN